MSDGRELWNGIKPYNPAILTGLPAGKWAESQKVCVAAWCCAMRAMYVRDTYVIHETLRYQFGCGGLTAVRLMSVSHDSLYL
jgi:hypothetical protein